MRSKSDVNVTTRQGDGHTARVQCRDLGGVHQLAATNRELEWWEVTGQPDRHYNLTREQAPIRLRSCRGADVVTGIQITCCLFLQLVEHGGLRDAKRRSVCESNCGGCGVLDCPVQKARQLWICA